MRALMASVLIVDPDASRAKVVTEVLARAAHGSRHVTSATAAIEALDVGLYDLVIVAESGDEHGRGSAGAGRRCRRSRSSACYS